MAVLLGIVALAFTFVQLRLFEGAKEK
jgi:hypothetical protein